MNARMVAEFADKRRKLYGLGASADNTNESHGIRVASQLCTADEAPTVFFFEGGRPTRINSTI